MITIPTVLVLGAGASMPYGFPSGAALVNYILQDIPPTTNSAPPPNRPTRRLFIYDFLTRLHGNEEAVRFRKCLELSGTASIDAFLERNSSELRTIGKAAIAAEILAAESTHALSSRGDCDWYRYFYGQILGCHAKDLGKNKLTVITYNYDRSFEYFLQRSFAHDCGVSQSMAAQELLGSIPILHLHGSLGPLPGFESKGAEAIRYAAPMESAEIITAARQRIRVISDPEVDNDPTFEKAHNALKEAGRIYFLGFGWAAENLRRLIPPRLTSSHKHAVGSSLGMGQAELQRLLKPAAEQNFTIETYPFDCLSLLKEKCFYK